MGKDFNGHKLNFGMATMTREKKSLLLIESSRTTKQGKHRHNVGLGMFFSQSKFHYTRQSIKKEIRAFTTPIRVSIKQELSNKLNEV